MKAYLKGEPYENLEIEVIKRLYPNSSDSSDKNFLKVSIKAKVHGFSAAFLCNVRADEINAWVDKLDTLINGESQIMFDNMEENLTIECILDLSGHVQWTCKIKGEESYSPVLSFKMETSIVAAEELRDGFKRILSEYPVLDTPVN